MLVDVQVAGGPDGEIEETVGGEQREHVIEKADAGVRIGLAAAVQVEGEGDVGFAGGALDRSG